MDVVLPEGCNLSQDEPSEHSLVKGNVNRGACLVFQVALLVVGCGGDCVVSPFLYVYAVHVGADCFIGYCAKIVVERVCDARSLILAAWLAVKAVMFNAVKNGEQTQNTGSSQSSSYSPFMFQTWLVGKMKRSVS